MSSYCACFRCRFMAALDDWCHAIDAALGEILGAPAVVAAASFAATSLTADKARPRHLRIRSVDCPAPRCLAPSQPRHMPRVLTPRHVSQFDAIYRALSAAESSGIDGVLDTVHVSLAGLVGTFALALAATCLVALAAIVAWALLGYYSEILAVRDERAIREGADAADRAGAGQKAGERRAAELSMH